MDTGSPQRQGTPQVASLSYSGHSTPLTPGGPFPHSLYFSGSIFHTQFLVHCVSQNLCLYFSYIFFVFYIFLFIPKTLSPPFLCLFLFFKYSFLSFSILFSLLCTGKKKEIQFSPSIRHFPGTFLNSPNLTFLICEMDTNAKTLKRLSVSSVSAFPPLQLVITFELKYISTVLFAFMKQFYSLFCF